MNEKEALLPINSTLARPGARSVSSMAILNSKTDEEDASFAALVESSWLRC
jgi:hypothetical protein